VAVPVSGPLRMAVIASPAYLNTPKAPRDLRSHRCINTQATTSKAASARWGVGAQVQIVLQESARPSRPSGALRVS
jgi:hypothetical protein